MSKNITGFYLHEVPIDPVTGLASLHYETAEEHGWYKIDLLNVGLYESITSEQHLLALMSAELDWQLFEHAEFVAQLIHLGNHAKMVSELKPASVIEIAMVLALIRPGKRYLINRCRERGFKSIKDEIWTEPTDGTYAFKKAHALSYAMLVKVNANLLIEQALTSQPSELNIES